MPKKIKTYTARQLAADWWWDEDHYAVAVNGKVQWDAAFVRSDSRRVRLSRLDPLRLCAVIAYVPLDMRMKLVKKVYRSRSCSTEG